MLFFFFLRMKREKKYINCSQPSSFQYMLLMTPPALLGMALVIVHLHLIKVMGDF